LPAALDLEETAVQTDQLTVDSVHGADAEVTVLLNFTEIDPSVEAPLKQALPGETCRSCRLYEFAGAAEKDTRR